MNGTIKELSALTYKELQQLASKHCVPGNIKVCAYTDFSPFVLVGFDMRLYFTRSSRCVCVCRSLARPRQVWRARGARTENFCEYPERFGNVARAGVPGPRQAVSRSAFLALEFLQWFFSDFELSELWRFFEKISFTPFWQRVHLCALMAIGGF